jgi:hypothetical protein
VQPAENEVQQFVDIRAAVIAGDLFVQMPPDSLDWIGFRSVGREEVQLDAMCPSGQVLLYVPATLGVVKDGIVADHVNASVAAEATSQVLEVCQEQVALRLGPARLNITSPLRQFMEPAK